MIILIVKPFLYIVKMKLISLFMNLQALSLLDIFADQDDNITGIQTPIEKL